MELSRPKEAFLLPSDNMPTQGWAPSADRQDPCSTGSRHLTSIFLPSGLENGIWPVEALDQCTLKALNDSQNSITVLNTEMTQMHKAVLQSRMAGEVLKAAQGGIYAIIKAEFFQVLTEIEQGYLLMGVIKLVLFMTGYTPGQEVGYSPR